MIGKDGIGRQGGQGVAGQFHFGNDRHIAAAGVFHHLAQVFLRIIGPGFHQVGIFLALNPPALVVGQVPVERIDLVQRQDVDDFLDLFLGLEMARHVGHDGPVFHRGRIVDAAARHGAAGGAALHRLRRKQLEQAPRAVKCPVGGGSLDEDDFRGNGQPVGLGREAVHLPDNDAARLSDGQPEGRGEIAGDLLEKRVRGLHGHGAAFFESKTTRSPFEVKGLGDDRRCQSAFFGLKGFPYDVGDAVEIDIGHPLGQRIRGADIDVHLLDLVVVLATGVFKSRLARQIGILAVGIGDEQQRGIRETLAEGHLVLHEGFALREEEHDAAQVDRLHIERKRVLHQAGLDVLDGVFGPVVHVVHPGSGDRVLPARDLRHVLADQVDRDRVGPVRQVDPAGLEREAPVEGNLPESDVLQVGGQLPAVALGGFDLFLDAVGRVGVAAGGGEVHHFPAPGLRKRIAGEAREIGRDLVAAGAEAHRMARIIDQRHDGLAALRVHQPQHIGVLVAEAVFIAAVVVDVAPALAELHLEGTERRIVGDRRHGVLHHHPAHFLPIGIVGLAFLGTPAAGPRRGVRVDAVHQDVVHRQAGLLGNGFPDLVGRLDADLHQVVGDDADLFAVLLKHQAMAHQVAVDAVRQPVPGRETGQDGAVGGRYLRNPVVAEIPLTFGRAGKERRQQQAGCPELCANPSHR